MYPRLRASLRELANGTLFTAVAGATRTYGTKRRDTHAKAAIPGDPRPDSLRADGGRGASRHGGRTDPACGQVWPCHTREYNALVPTP